MPDRETVDVDHAVEDADSWAATESELMSLQSRSAAAEAERDRLLEDLSDQQREIGIAQGDAVDNAMQVQGLRSENDKLRAELAAARQSAERLRSNAAAMHEAHALTATRTEELTTQLADAHRTLHQMRRPIGVRHLREHEGWFSECSDPICGAASRPLSPGTENRGEEAGRG